MSREFQLIRAVVTKVRRRWMWHTIFRCARTAAVSCAVVLAAATALVSLLAPSSVAGLAAVSSAVVVVLLAAIGRAVWPLTRRPTDVQVARFIEERCPQLEDRLATAVECAPKAGTPAGMLADLLYRDAASRAAGLDLDRTVSRRMLVRSGSLALASTLVLAGVMAAFGPQLVGRVSAVQAVVKPARPVARRAHPSAVVHPAAVTSIDVQYTYPPELRLAPRTEEATGDIYAPAGTRVQLRIHTDKPVRAGSLLVAGAAPAPLSAHGDRLLGASLTVTADGSYRVALTDANNLESPGDVEYFIRMLADAPPDVRIVEPAADRQVTPLEEVTVTAHAEDDHGLKDFDLVYSVRGGPEVAVPFSTRGNRQALDGQRVLYLEEMQVRPGDFVSYYARARDAARTGEAGEARSDIFFLQVTPFEQEFIPPQSSQAASGGAAAAGHSLDDLIEAQKAIIVATWRLDRRARKSHSSGSEVDVKTIARAQGDLKSRALGMAGPTAAPAVATPRDGQAGAEAAGGGDAMTNAIDAMGKAEQSLDAVNTTSALPQETRALSELLKAQASNQRWQMRQAARGGAGGDNSASNADLTTLFDQELQRQQRTNYEMPRGSDQREAQTQSEALERVRQMAQRQDELARQQQELARDRAKMSDDEVKRQLERLTREQAELRQEAEQLAQQMKTRGLGTPKPAQSKRGEGGPATPKPGQNAREGGSTSQGGERGLGEASDAMRQAASNLRDGKLDEASARSSQAADSLRSAERQMRGRQGGGGSPTLGDLQLQARQLTDAQGQVAREAASAGTGKAAADTMRRLAGEKERLADQAEQLGQGVRSAAANPGLEGRQRQLVDAVSRDLDRLQLPKQMRDSAAAMRAPDKADVNRPPSAEGEQELAKTLGRLADRMAAAAGSRETQQASEQLGETRDMRDRLARLERQIADLQRQGAKGSPNSGARGRSSSTDSSASGKAVGTSGRGGSGDQTETLERLQDQYARELRRAADQLNRFGAEGGGQGITPPGARTLSPLSAPGFHQDYSKWEHLSHEISAGLERAETALAKKLRDQEARDRLQAPSSGRVPESYRRLVEQYYESLARDKR